MISIYVFSQAVKTYSKELEQDRIVAKHLDTLYQTMLEQNLCRIIEPYKRVQVRMTINFAKSISVRHNHSL